MKTKKRGTWIVGLVITISLLAAGLAVTESSSVEDAILEKLQKEFKPVEPLLSPDVEIRPGFQPGAGPAIGNVQAAQGDAFVVHKGQKAAYRLMKDHPLFTGDTLVASDRSRLNAMLNDKSVLALASYSKLVIDKSVYDANKDERSSLLTLLFGRARFIIAKLRGADPNYTIQTPTAVCGVRGSDLALAVVPDGSNLSSTGGSLASRLGLIRVAHAAPAASFLTTIVTGPGTTVGFSGLVGPTQIVGPASVCSAAAGAAAISPIGVGAAAAAGALNAIGPGLASISMPPGYK